MIATSKRVSLDILRPGVVLTAPIADPEHPRVLLLGAGVTMTNNFIDALRKRGVESVVLSDNDIATLRAFSSPGRRSKVPPPHQYPRSAARNDYSRNFDRWIESEPLDPLVDDAEPFAEQLQSPQDCGYAEGIQVDWARDNNQQVECVDRFYEESTEGSAEDVGPLLECVDGIFEKLAEDKDAFVCMASTPYEAHYPSRHSVHVAGMAITIGTVMNLSKAALTDLGIGCLIHDVGMKAVGCRLFNNKKSLSPLQLNRLSDHPVKSLEVACELGDEVSHRAKMVAYQIHERNDGSGYPRQWTGERIHPFAKIAAVADSYVAMLTNRKHRVAVQGYFAIEHLLTELKAGKFCPHVIRALLNCTSLYPLGSLVKLNNGRIGRVIRSGGENFVQPTVEMWDPTGCTTDRVIVNLKHEPALKITNSVSLNNLPLKRVA